MKIYTKKFDVSFRNLYAGIGTTLLALTACSKTAHYGVESEVSPKKVAESSQKRPQREESPFCLICHEAMQENEPEEDWLTEEQCKKPFHKICMLGWFITSNPGQKTCPACRGQLSAACLASVLPEQLHIAINNIISEDNTGRTLLHWAVINGQLEIVERLITNGVDINVRDGSGQTPLHLAVINRHFEIVQWLIEKGADVNSQDNQDDTPLIWAVLNRHFEIVQFLIEKGAEVTTVNDFGETPLHVAVRKGYPSIVKLLIGKGAEVNMRDMEDQTPLDLATELKVSNEIVQLLTAHGNVIRD
ncbi:MAG TPA: ankyrin repeat domain-containing protein [Amoebophilaceae bacterium]|nr:ankyrin repeat domain-containing protein [Amoebophilaceae bacterium]